MIAHLDFETRSDVDLRKEGLEVYSQSSYTDILCAAFAFDESPVELWKKDTHAPESLIEFVRQGGTVAAHNAQFELVIWNEIGSRLGWPVLKTSQVYCTMAQAYAMALPGSLEKVAPALGLTNVKDAKGSRVMLQLAKPRGYYEDGTPYFWDVANARNSREEQAILAKFDVLYEYCKQDVEVEREVDNRTLALTPQETAVWQLDQKINRRGIRVDTKAAETALEIVKIEKKKLNSKMFEVTDGFVRSCSEVTNLKDWLHLQGVECDGVAKDDIRKMLEDENTPKHCRDALWTRRAAAKTSTAKLEAMIRRAGHDGRVRFTLQYHGASTGRWAGRGIQVHNLPRPRLKQTDIREIFSWLKGHTPEKCAELIDTLYGNPTEIISNCLRGFLLSTPGCRLIAGDWSAIEARMLAWLAGEESVLEVFRGHGKIYEREAAGIYNVPMEQVNMDQRLIGKVAVLALGYQGGVGAFQSMAKNFGIKITDAKADEIKHKWRANNSKIVRYWYDVEAAAFRAVMNPGQKYFVGEKHNQVTYLMSGSFLLCRLPSGRALCYPYPRIEQKETPWGAMKEVITFMGEDTYTRKWMRLHTYGGSLVENITQASSRDVLVESMFKLEERNYPVVMHVHDEVVCELAGGNAEEVKEIMEIVPKWAEGLPLKAETWMGERYRK